MTHINRWQQPNKKRNDKIIELHDKGLSFREIGKKFNITQQRAWKIYKKYKSEANKES